MKTLRTMTVLIALLCIAPFNSPVLASDPNKVTIDQELLSRLSPADQERALCLAERLEDLGNTDRSQLTTGERKELRREWRELRHEVNALNAAAGGTVIYISTGLIIIILLLIILL